MNFEARSIHLSAFAAIVLLLVTVSSANAQGVPYLVDVMCGDVNIGEIVVSTYEVSGSGVEIEACFNKTADCCCDEFRWLQIVYHVDDIPLHTPPQDGDCSDNDKPSVPFIDTPKGGYCEWAFDDLPWYNEIGEGTVDCPYPYYLSDGPNVKSMSLIGTKGDNDVRFETWLVSFDDNEKTICGLAHIRWGYKRVGDVVTPYDLESVDHLTNAEIGTALDNGMFGDWTFSDSYGDCCPANLDVVFIMDVTGSTGALLPNWQAQMPGVISDIQAAFPGTKFGLVSHLDFPFAPYGDVGEWAYRMESPLSDDPTQLSTALAALSNGWGYDEPESQYEAIYQTVSGEGRDLTGDGDFTDVGEIAPSNMGYGPSDEIVIFHFTYPVEFHDRDAEPYYPYAGSAPVAGRTATIDLLLAEPVIYFGLITAKKSSDENSLQTGEPLDDLQFARGMSQMQELADITGGAVLDVGYDLSGLDSAIAQAIYVIDPQMDVVPDSLDFSPLRNNQSYPFEFTIYETGDTTDLTNVDISIENDLIDEYGHVLPMNLFTFTPSHIDVIQAGGSETVSGMLSVPDGAVLDLTDCGTFSGEITVHSTKRKITIAVTATTSVGPIPTNEWINVYCRCPKLNGVLLSEGDVIKAYDPDGVLCGQDVVRADGSFGFMPIYRDDFVTPNLDEGAEPGDQISFTINDVEVFTDPVIYWTSNGDSYELCRFHTCKIIHLHEGWNLISWNLNYTELTSDFVLSHLDKCECVDVILGFDRGAMTYDPFLPQYSTLPYVDYFHGYWLKMHCAWDLEICGEAIDPSEYIDIYTGWNLVSYWPVQTLPLEVGFATILDCIEIAIGFDNGGQVWVPGKEPFNTLTDLSELFGYWIKSSCDGALIYPGWDTPPPAPDGLAKPLANSDRDVTPSRTWMSLYGSDIKVDGSIIDNNSVIEAYSTDQVLCGRGVYTDGMLRFTPVYGQDNLDDATAGYPTGEEQFSICVNKVRVYPDITWTGNGNVFGLTQLSTKATAAGLQPIDYSLAQNYPNPFNPTTVISYNLPSASHVRLSVYNLLGQNVRTLVDGESTAGAHREIWDATDDGGNPVASGVYFYRLETTDFTQTKKMLLAK
ncbi:MAG: T9SS type A sorting domain-containing protein [Candidatus Zixiibacteriota bacterium]